MSEKIINDPALKTRFDIFRRSLHSLALIQHHVESEKMNSNTIANLLSYLERGEPLDSKSVTTCLANLEKIGFPVQTRKGGDRVLLSRELSQDEMLEVLLHYLNVVCDPVGIRDCFKSYVENHNSRSLWLLARIHFAAFEKRRVKLSYRSLKSSEYEDYTLNPYFWIYRDNAVYLAANYPARGVSLFRLNRIKDVQITEERFDEELPDADELLSCSMGAFISDERYNVVLRFHERVKGQIEEDFGRLELKFKNTENGYMEVSFTVSDLLTVCRTVFGYGGAVVIVSPEEARREMLNLLNENMAQY